MSQPVDTAYVVVARWEPLGEVAIWRGGVFSCVDEAMSEWEYFEREVGGAKFCYLLKIVVDGTDFAFTNVVNPRT